MSPLPADLSDRDGKIRMDGQLVEWRDATKGSRHSQYGKLFRYEKVVYNPHG